MEYDNGRIKGFELKFKSLEKDLERYTFALLDLLEAGKIQLVPPAKSLVASHYYDEGYAWIMDSYFEKGLFGQIEQYFTPAGEVLFPPQRGNATIFGPDARQRRERARATHLARLSWTYEVGVLVLYQRARQGS